MCRCSSSVHGGKVNNLQQLRENNQECRGSYARATQHDGHPVAPPRAAIYVTVTQVLACAWSCCGVLDARRRTPCTCSIAFPSREGGQRTARSSTRLDLHAVVEKTERANPSPGYAEPRLLFAITHPMQGNIRRQNVTAQGFEPPPPPPPLREFYN